VPRLLRSRGSAGQARPPRPARPSSAPDPRGGANRHPAASGRHPLTLRPRGLACGRARRTRRLVARGGFEPPKPLGRQIYSLLRLTAPQPRHVRASPRAPPSPSSRLLPPPRHAVEAGALARPAPSCTALSASTARRRTSAPRSLGTSTGRAPTSPVSPSRRGQPAASVWDACDRFRWITRSAQVVSWSWRRDSNPRPADYKSAALPTELRQPARQNDVYSTLRAVLQARLRRSATPGLAGAHARRAYLLRGDPATANLLSSHETGNGCTSRGRAVVRSQVIRRNGPGLRAGRHPRRAAAAWPRTARCPPPPPRSGSRRGRPSGSARASRTTRGRAA
jgi:hypothetical protein